MPQVPTEWLAECDDFDIIAGHPKRIQGPNGFFFEVKPEGQHKTRIVVGFPGAEKDVLQGIGVELLDGHYQTFARKRTNGAGSIIFEASQGRRVKVRFKVPKKRIV